MSKTIVKNARLDSVARAKEAYVVAKASLERRLREQMKDELANLQTQIDIAVRFAYESGEKKAEIMRALGTKDYHTINASLERTQGVQEIVGIDPLDSVYTLMGEDTVVVSYVQHGPNKYTGEASFNIKRLDNGTLLFLSLDPLFNEDYTVRNEAVMALDQKSDGYYYYELCEWLAGRQ